MNWNWFLSGLSILLNIVSIVILFQCKKLNNLDEPQKIDDVQVIQQSIGEFVAKLERENEVLYEKLVDYIKEKESVVDEKFRSLEEKIISEGTSTSVIEQSSDILIDRNQSDNHQLDQRDQAEEKISQLYKQGFSPKQIAKVLRIDHGKVDLIINMFKKRQSYPK